jgi:flagellar hook protein FlgE
MSLYGALFSGVSGLQAQSSAMGAIADNVTNVNTTGYKSTNVNFQTLVTKQASLTKYSAGGVQSKPRQGVDVQGLLQSTSSSTDISISGNGYFIVNEAGDPGQGDIYAYTRAGSFQVDKEGYLQNTSGYYLQGWPLQTWDGSTQAVQVTENDDTYMKAYQNDSGDTVYINDNIVDSSNLRPLNLQTIGGTAVASTSISMGANLPSEDDVGTTHKTDVLIYDSLGGAHNINHTWTKRASNGWDLSVVPPEGSESIVVEDQTTDRKNYMSVGRLDFTSIPDAGTALKLTLGGTSYSIEFTAGTDDDTIDTDTIAITTAPVDNDTITINGVVYEFQTDTDVTGTADVVISIASGANAATAAAALASAMETRMDSDRGAGSWVSVNGTTITVNNSSTYTTGVSTATTGTIAVTNTTGVVSADRSLSVSISNRSLSQVMDEIADRMQAITQYEFDGVTDSPPNSWAERIAGENAVVFHNVDTANAIAVDAGALTTSGSNAVQQSTAYTVEAVDSTINWTQSTNHAVSFNGDGTPDQFFGTDEATASDPRIQYKINWANGAENMDGSDSSALSVSLGNYNVADGLTQFGGDYQINYISQNGAAFGNFAGLSVGDDGIVTALFDNGVTRPVFMIPLATMVNPNGMESLSGNVWIETDFSGQPTVREAGSAGAGTTNQAALEASTVDLGEEFTSMITTQRAYSAAAKIISTSDEMLEELLRVKR